MANKIIVCQSGPRHRYLIPQILENNKLLYRLYTDTTVYSKLGKFIRIISHLLSNNSMKSLINKRDPKIPINKLYTSDRMFFKQIISSIVKDRTNKYWEDRYLGFSKDCIKWGVGEADCIYSMFVENSNFLITAKKTGVKVGFDMYEAANTNKYLIKEIEENEDYAIYKYLIPQYKLSDDVKTSLIEPLLLIADFYTVPSQFVAKSMEEYKNFNKSKVIILPYASSICSNKYNYTPKKHRLIWVGNEPVRKGLLYCAKAATILKEIYTDLDFRIIGKVDERLKQNPTFKDLNFLGVLCKEELINEYISAEAYVFPTLFEGFAGTLIEAASCGCPIITTKCAGTDVNKFPAIYIKSKDVQEIVDSVKMIFDNREFRDNLSHEVFKYAQELSPAAYEKRLIKVLSEI